LRDESETEHSTWRAIVVCDNTTSAAEEYRDYFKFVNDPNNRFRTMTVPFQGGFELTVRV